MSDRTVSEEKILQHLISVFIKREDPYKLTGDDTTLYSLGFITPGQKQALSNTFNKIAAVYDGDVITPGETASLDTIKECKKLIHKKVNREDA